MDNSGERVVPCARKRERRGQPAFGRTIALPLPRSDRQRRDVIGELRLQESKRVRASEGDDSVIGRKMRHEIQAVGGWRDQGECGNGPQWRFVNGI